jgi:2-methylaconitate cis-trans-isomerase PrpF
VLRKDLPVSNQADLDAWILAIYGSPDRRQIDGIGGADILTSKFAVVGPPTRPDADVDYSFFQVDIRSPAVLRDLNCGNISAAIGPFAIDAGLVAAVDSTTPVRIHATNFGKIIHASVPVLNGRARVSGDTSIDGVPGTGAPIVLDFRDTVGGITGKLLPTGNAMDTVMVEGVGPIQMTIIDLANLVCYVKAESLGLQGNEDPLVLASNMELMERCERIRLTAAVMLGMRPDISTALRQPSPTPWLSIVSPPQAWPDFATGKPHEKHECDISARLYTRRNIHKAYPGTGSACLGAAVRIPGSVPWQLVSKSLESAMPLRIGHPCGVLDVTARVQTDAFGGLKVEQASFIRTARRIADGHVYAPTSRLPWLHAATTA